MYHYHVQDTMPFTFGCYGPNPDNSLVTTAQCGALYTGCAQTRTTASVTTTEYGTFNYKLWCPCRHQACSAGQFAIPSTSTCLQCAAGKYSAAGAGVCVTCAAGKTSSSGSFSCSGGNTRLGRLHRVCNRAHIQSWCGKLPNLSILLERNERGR